MNMIIEQTPEYTKRMIYHPESNTFTESEHNSLLYDRKFPHPYGWIKESGTPPAPHCDCILMTQKEYALGDEVPIKLIGIFKRKDGDHKYLAVETDRQTEDYTELTLPELISLKKLYPCIADGEGWFGKKEAVSCYEHCERTL